MVYLIPSFLDAGAHDTLTPGVLNALRSCQLFFVENERSARRFIKSIWKECIIDDYEWIRADRDTVQDTETRQAFVNALKAKKNIAILSEAGCPGIADPGQELVALAHQHLVPVRPLVGPSAILLALMGSGMNGQQFSFCGYLPIEKDLRMKKIRELEKESAQKKMTQVFMETPYRNQALLETLLKTCQKDTRLCIAASLTAPDEFILTKRVGEWRGALPDLHKKPCLFLLLAE